MWVKAGRAHGPVEQRHCERYLFGRCLGFVWAFDGEHLVLALLASDRQMRQESGRINPAQPDLFAAMGGV